MHNNFERNKRIYPEPYGGPVKTSALIPLPPADKGTTGGKGSGQDGWESLDGVVEGPVQAMNNEGPMPSRTKQIFDEVKRDIAAAERRRIDARVPRWPDSGIAMPTGKKPNYGAALARGLQAAAQATGEVIQDAMNVIFPREVGEDGVLRDKKIHQFGLNENIDDAFDRTSIDKPNDENEDMNAWGGEGYDYSVEDSDQFAQAIAALSGGEYVEDDENIDRDDIGSSVDSEEDKYGENDRVYPSEAEYRTEGFYNSLFAPATKAFKWLIPGYVAAGPHPIYTSHLEDLSELKRAGIKAIVTLFDKPLDAKYIEDFQHLFVATVEGHASDLQRVCKFIHTQQRLGNTVFIHDMHGKGRVGTALAAYLMHEGWVNGAEEAMTYIRENYHKDAIETSAQEDALLKFMLNE